jgi:hypothetical protein
VVSRRTLIVSALSAAAVLLVTGTLLTQAAARASGQISASASSPTTSVGQLSISFTAGTAITSFTVHILTASGTDVLDLPEADFTMTSSSTGTDTASSTWTLSQAITTSQLLLGTYAITVDAADAGGDAVAGQAAGTLDYLIQPTVTLTASPAVLGYASPSTTLSGTVTGQWPDGSNSPLAGQAVLVTNSEGQSQQAQTNASGDFTTSASNADTFTASVSGSTLASASSPPVAVTAVTTPTELTATGAPAKVSYGQQVTVSGELSYEPGTTYEGLAGMSVVVVTPGYPQLSIPVTDADGAYSASFTATQSGPVFVYFNNAQYQESGSVPYLAPAQAETDQITVERQTSLTQFAATVTSSGIVNVHGCVGIADLPAGTADVAGTVTIQYSASTAGPWHRLGTIGQFNSEAGSTCGIATVEASYTGSFTVKLARAYYRASFTPQASANLLGSVSTPVLAWKYSTRVESLKVSARRISKGGKLTISGQLLQDTKRWVPYGQQQLLVVYRKPNGKLWYSSVTVTTNSAGEFSATVKDSVSAIWSVLYAGNATHYDCRPAGIKVTV